MIPHHSMAIHMSKQLLEKEKNTSSSSRRFIQNIIDTQENEIMIFKKNEL
jgi:uncharacterized protein (DUF305 family)